MERNGQIKSEALEVMIIVPQIWLFGGIGQEDRVQEIGRNTRQADTETALRDLVAEIDCLKSDVSNGIKVLKSPKPCQSWDQEGARNTH